MRPNQAGELRCAVLQSFQKQTGVAQFVFIRGVPKQCQGSCIRCQLVGWIALKIHSLKGVLVRKKEAISEGKFGIDTMSEGNMAELMREHHSQRGLVR